MSINIRLILAILVCTFGFLMGNLAYHGSEPASVLGTLICIFSFFWTIGTCSWTSDPDSYASTGKIDKLWIALYPIVFFLTILFCSFFNIPV
jgi:hypothetical protein